MKKLFFLLSLIAASSISAMESGPQASVAKDPDQVRQLYYQVDAEKKKLDGVLRNELSNYINEVKENFCALFPRGSVEYRDVQQLTYIETAKRIHATRYPSDKSIVYSSDQKERWFFFYVKATCSQDSDHLAQLPFSASRVTAILKQSPSVIQVVVSFDEFLQKVRAEQSGIIEQQIARLEPHAQQSTEVQHAIECLKHVQSLYK